MDDLLRSAPGFGLCGQCEYRETAPASLCYACARRSMENLAAPGSRCKVCDRPHDPGEDVCHNPVCNFDDRYFQWNFAVAMRSGNLEDAINRYKYGGRRGWRLIFGRILASFLDDYFPSFMDVGLIVASPTWTGAGGRDFDHTREVLASARDEMLPGSGWPFDDLDDPAIIKTAATPRLAACKTFKERRTVAEGDLRNALTVAHPERVRDQEVLVYDDVFTDGLTLREVARALIVDGGAAGVCGVSLCRQPYRSRQ